MLALRSSPLFCILVLLLQVCHAAAEPVQLGCFPLDPVCTQCQGTRYGEASHPGPSFSEEFSLFSTNPSGLRGKESALLEHGVGAFLIAETHLSAVTQKTSRSQIEAIGRSSNRRLRAHYGEAVSLRAQSDWAGTWSGVATVSDFPSRPVRIDWPPQTYEAGRVAIAQHHVHSVPLLTAVVYGVPRSQAHPHAQEETEAVLQPLTREVVLGRKGRRDFNHPQGSSREIAIWQEHGWQEVQDIAQARWGKAVEMTCRGATRHDFIWLSPEAAAMCCGSGVHHSFADHVVLEAILRVPPNTCSICTWPRPATIPWEETDIENWHRTAMPFESSPVGHEPTQWFREFTNAWECSVEGFVEGPSNGLPAQCKGRASRTVPTQRELCPSVLKASRPGEICIANDLLSREVKRWFQQLRRLQSLRQALRAAKDTPQARQYRSQLWGSILCAKGFAPDFRQWWPKRAVRLQGAPDNLPPQPTLSEIGVIYEDFLQNYTKMERWHLHRRGEILEAKHAESSRLLFATLRPPRPPPLDTLVVQHSYEVLSADAENRMIHLDGEPSNKGTSCFTVNGEHIRLTKVEGGLCQIHPADAARAPEGALVEQEQFLSEPDHVFAEFIHLWQPRWNQHANMQPEHWARILGFTRFLRPQASFVFPPLSAAQWTRAVQRLKPSAARGPDAYARLDLLHMAPCYVAQLLQLLDAIEKGQVEWPAQLLQGFVCVINKQNQKTGADAYRPICLLSVIYRLWASIRTRQLLRALKSFAPDEMFGFMPSRETADMWIVLQAQIEMACMQDVPLVGCMADVVKAFNGLPRQPLLRAAARMGFPSCVLTPWISFVSRVQRRFVMGEAVSMAVTSSSGFIEGDPLSVTAMTVASIMFHHYMAHFEPRVVHASYVDNLSTTAESVYLVARGYTVMESFWELLGLQLDAEKTYYWATWPADRKLLLTLGLTVAEHRRELGGYLTFGPRHRVSDMMQRLELLQPLWHTLRRTRAPVQQKWAAITTKFWPMVFHGVPSCWLPDGTVDKLRTKLAWALHWTCAGAGPDLRALTEGPLELDPGFFQVWSSFREFRRLASKSPTLQQLWRGFALGFQGREFAGPFSTLCHHARALGWGLAEPPSFTDHRGLTHNLLKVPKSTLRFLTEDAWARKVSIKQAGRPALSSKPDLDVKLAREVGRAHTPQQKAWLGMIRAGAAITGAQQSHFDTTKTDQCVHCLMPDTKAHRLFECPLYAGLGLCLQDSDTRHLTELLLPSWHPDLDEHLRALMDLPDGGDQWTVPAAEVGHVDLFTDGSCMHGTEGPLALGAWAVVCAQMNTVIASGWLQGICQTIDRCELFAIVVSLRWAARVGCGITVWTDSKFVFDQLLALLQGEVLTQTGQTDLWLEVVKLLDVCAAVYVQWVPSHVDPNCCLDPVAEYASMWNRAVDRQAVYMNHMRDEGFMARHCRILQHRRKQRDRLVTITGQYMRIAEVSNANRRGPADREEMAIAEVEQLPLVHWSEGFSEQFPPNWAQFLAVGEGQDVVEAGDVVQCVLSSDEGDVPKFRVTWIELVFFVVVVQGCGDQFRGRTLAYWVTRIRRILRPLLIRFGARNWLVKESLCGVAFPVEALILGITFENFQLARSRFREWAGDRLIKKVADLARPVRPQ